MHSSTSPIIVQCFQRINKLKMGFIFTSQNHVSPLLFQTSKLFSYVQESILSLFLDFCLDISLLLSFYMTQLPMIPGGSQKHV